MKKIITFWMAACLLAGACLMSSCKKDDAKDPTPSAPGELTMPSGVTCEASETSLSFAWEAVTNAAAYSIEFRDASQATVTASVTAASWVKEGLESETDYEFRVKAVPAADSEKYLDSPWTEWKSFSTTEGLIASKFSAGDGTEDNPYIIMTPGQLAYMAKVINEEEPGYCEFGVYYELGADIDLKAYDEWTPIGIGTGSKFISVSAENMILSKVFLGYFNGANHKITNLNVVMSASGEEVYAGLFGASCGKIEFVKVEGSVTARSLYTEGGYLMVGGIVGYSQIGYEDGSNTSIVPHTGMIMQCSFSGSVLADSNMDQAGSVVAGGICGRANSGNIENSEVTIPAGKSIHAIAGYAPTAGGVVGYQDAGRIKKATVTVAGDVVAEYLSEVTHDQEGSDDTVKAGGVCGGTGRLQGGSAGDLGASECVITVSGTIKAAAKGYAAVAAAGAFAGTSNCDPAGGLQAEITSSGKIIAESDGSLYLGGMIGALMAGYGGGNQVFNASVDMKGELIARQTLESGMMGSSSVNVGGVLGGLGSGAPGGLVLCSAKIDGKITVSSATTGNQFTNVGGVAGNIGNLSGSSAVFSDNAVVDISAKTINFGGTTGAYRGSNMIKHLGDYAFINGKIKTHPASAGADYTANIGGVAGSVDGSRVGMNFQMAKIYSSYAVLNASIETEPTATVMKGAVAGRGARYGFITCYWSSSDADIFGFGSDDAEFATDGIVKFASLDQAGYEAAMADMNQTIIDEGLEAQYKYDAQKGYLTF